MELFSNTFSNLENALNYSSLKQKVISQNIANADTPNYKAKDVVRNESFQSVLQSSISSYKTDNRHFDFSGSRTSSASIVQRDTKYNNNGNSVDVDKEMSDLAANQILFNALTDRISGKFKSLENVIRGGK
ncbi:flagellar basal body rod protein FlgB [Peribacillus sp. SCS-155]|uniref:flagellar basal body rod protein FlgB n=1 Tax=Peribacillus sedimenti TaxID=3115297 RepID=UPI0039064467